VTQGRLILDLIEDGINVAFIVTLLFPFLGLPKVGIWPWWQHDWGWNMVAFDVCVALALLPSWLRRVLGVDPNTYIFGWVVAISIWAIPCIVLWRVLLIWQAQRSHE
jgi:hypothetical protein